MRCEQRRVVQPHDNGYSFICICALRGDKFEARESACCMKIATARNVSVFQCRSKVLRVDSTAVVVASYFRAREA